MRIIKKRKNISTFSKIFAADEDFGTDDYDIEGTIDNSADDVEAIQDKIDEVQEDD